LLLRHSNSLLLLLLQVGGFIGGGIQGWPAASVARAGRRGQAGKGGRRPIDDGQQGFGRAIFGPPLQPAGNLRVIAISLKERLLHVLCSQLLNADK
jgi:hypothetical protein